jgi:hypothetical protein
MRKIILIIVFLVGGIIFLKLNFQQQKKIDKDFLEDINLQLLGVVDTVDKGNHYHGYGIIRLKVISSNIQEYDPRHKQEFYFCIIKNGIAEVYDHTSATYKQDTLFYDTKLKIGGFLKNGKKEEVGSISINTDKNYYNYIREHTIFK